MSRFQRNFALLLRLLPRHCVIWRFTTTTKTSVARQHQSTMDQTEGLQARIAVNEQRSLLTGVPSTIPLERSGPQCASCDTDDWYLHCGRSCGLCATTTLSHAAMATLVLVDL